MTNAERQREYRKRRKQGVTPDDVLRAAQIIYTDHSSGKAGAKPWAEFAASFTGKRRDLWSQWVPDSIDPSDYPDDLSADDLALCLKVAAVARAVRFPPD